MSNDTLDTLLNVIIVAGVIVLIFNYTYGNNTGGEYEISGAMDNGTNVTRVILEDTDTANNNTSIIGVNDTYFKNWVTISFKTMAENLNCISEAGKNRNFTDMERCGKFLSQNSDNALRFINEYNVSPSMRVVLEEYKKALESYNIGGVKLETGARNRNASQMGNAIKYIEGGTASVNNVTTILYPNGTFGTKNNQEID